MEMDLQGPVQASGDGMDKMMQTLTIANEQKASIINRLADYCRRDIGDELMDVYTFCLSGVSVEDVNDEVNRILWAPGFDRVMPTPGELLAGIKATKRRERLAESARKDAADRATGWSAPAAELCLRNITAALRAGEISEETYHRIRLSKVVRPSERRQAIDACQAITAETRERLLRLYCPAPGAALSLPPGQGGQDGQAPEDERRGLRTGGLRRLV